MEATYRNSVYIINIAESFTPKVFYENYLKELGLYLRKNRDMKDKEEHGETLFIDLSGCRDIEGSVIPNLLATGVIVKKNTGNTPILYIPENGDSKIMNYLKAISFEDINSFLDIFYIKTNRWMRQEKKYKLPDFCTTLYLSKNLSEEKVAEELQKKYLALFTEYLADFTYELKNSKTQEGEPVNLLEIFCKQICCNAITHGESFCFVTMQVNRYRKKIFISISDCGKGMYGDFKQKMKEKEYQPLILPKGAEEIKKDRRMEMDGMAITEGIMYRFGDSVYGLWNVLKSVMDVHGIVRIHSGKARVAISGLEYSEFEKYDKKKAAGLLYRRLMSKLCVSQTPDYSGTHVEIELPLRV